MYQVTYRHLRLFTLFRWDQKTMTDRFDMPKVGKHWLRRSNYNQWERKRKQKMSNQNQNPCNCKESMRQKWTSITHAKGPLITVELSPPKRWHLDKKRKTKSYYKLSKKFKKVANTKKTRKQLLCKGNWINYQFEFFISQCLTIWLGILQDC